MIDKNLIKWDDPKSKISKYFTVHEALYLPSWELHHIPSEQEKAAIINMAQKMDLVREYLGNAIIVHCWIRPKSVNQPKSARYHLKNYNAACGGAPGSAHMEGIAVDFHVAKMTCDEARHLLVSKLDEFKIRMEDISGNWVHVDMRNPAPKKSRFFKP